MSQASSVSSSRSNSPIILPIENQERRLPAGGPNVAGVAQANLPSQQPPAPPLGLTHVVTAGTSAPQVAPLVRLMTSLTTDSYTSNTPYAFSHNETMYAVWATPPKEEGVRIQIQPWTDWQAGGSSPNKNKLSILIDPVSGTITETSMARQSRALFVVDKHLINALLESAEIPPLFRDLTEVEGEPPQPTAAAASSSAPSLTNLPSLVNFLNQKENNTYFAFVGDQCYELSLQNNATLLVIKNAASEAMPFTYSIDAHGNALDPNDTREPLPTILRDTFYRQA